MAELYNKETEAWKERGNNNWGKKDRQADAGRSGRVSISKSKLLQLKAVLYFSIATSLPFDTPV